MNGEAEKRAGRKEIKDAIVKKKRELARKKLHYIAELERKAAIEKKDIYFRDLDLSDERFEK